MRRYSYFFIVIITVIFFLLNSAVTLKGAAAGLILWFQTVIPTLLPFMILSSVLVKLKGEQLLAGFLSPVTGPLLGLSSAGNYVLFIGLFCGYPLGAKTAAELVKENRLSAAEGQYLMNFCNNVSPAFTVSFICTSLLNNKSIIPKALLLLYGVPVIVGMLTKRFYLTPHKNLIAETAVSPRNEHGAFIEILDSAIADSAMTALKLGGYIIMFSIFVFITEASALPGALKTLLLLMLEVTNGCKNAVCSSFLISRSIVYPALFSCATFGGIAGLFQTAGMIRGTCLSMKHYILFRLVCSACVFILSLIIL